MSRLLQGNIPILFSKQQSVFNSIHRDSYPSNSAIVSNLLYNMASINIVCKIGYRTMAIDCMRFVMIAVALAIESVGISAA